MRRLLLILCFLLLGGCSPGSWAKHFPSLGQMPYDAWEEEHHALRIYWNPEYDEVKPLPLMPLAPLRNTRVDMLHLERERIPEPR